MFITTLCAPLTALYVCGSVASTVILMTVGGCLAVYLISDVDPGMIGTADITSACVSTAVVALYFGVALYMIYWRNIESYFCSFPWLTTTSASREKVGGRVYQRLCPFTGLRPGFRCPSCQCRIHEKAFHKMEPYIKLPGETVLRWDLAGNAAENEDPDSAQVRAALDEALDLRGNIYTQCVSDCCIGCATWQKCFNLAPRLALSLALSAMFFAYVPWAFTSFLQLIGSGGGIVKMITGSLSVGLAVTALLVQVRALGRANAFLSRHTAQVHEMHPLKAIPETGIGAVLSKILFSTKWDPLL